MIEAERGIDRQIYRYIDRYGQLDNFTFKKYEKNEMYLNPFNLE